LRLANDPPRLIVKTLTATFVTATILLIVVFFAITMSVRDQVRRAVTSNLESSQRMFSLIETRQQRDMRAQAANLAENPTLKAAIDTYAAESRAGNTAAREQLLTTIANELAKVAARIEADAVVVVDAHQTSIAAAGPLADRWPAGRPVSLVKDAAIKDSFDGVVHTGRGTFRVVTVPLALDDGTTIGTLYLATNLDRGFAEQLSELSRTRVAIVSDGRLIASTFSPDSERQLEAYISGSGAVDGTADLNGEAYAFIRLVQVGDTRFYALASIDESSRAASRAAMRTLVFLALGATGFALLGSVWLAHLLSEPIGQLSSSLQTMATSRDFTSRLPLTGSSREVDTLAGTFNALMASVASAEAETEAAYTGAIRALAAALDARDPYTAGHSERVSVLSVAIGRTMNLSPDDLEVVRLGALLHDIGKIGVPDDVLRKPGPLSASEFETIKQHPGLGAGILRSVPFLARHIPIVELHHERPDGRGYPHGLHGKDIPLAAAIVHVADAYDAMTSARAYRNARPSGDALRELWRGAGTEFHAETVGALAAAQPGLTSSVAEPGCEAVSG
jgi:putative nucleotidyltransferase with HDIG domain